MGGAAFFVDQKKGEINELKQVCAPYPRLSIIDVSAATLLADRVRPLSSAKPGRRHEQVRNAAVAKHRSVCGLCL